MVGEWKRHPNLDPGVAKRREEFVRVADPGKRQHGPALERGERLRIGSSGHGTPAGHGPAWPWRHGRPPVPHQQRATPGRGEANSAAEPAAGPPETPGRCRCRGGRGPSQDRTILVQPGLWKPSSITIEARAGRACRVGAGGAVARNHGGGEPGQQEERLIADLGGAMPRRIDLHRPSERTAIAAAEHERPASGDVRDPPLRSRPVYYRRRRVDESQRRLLEFQRRGPAVPHPLRRHRTWTAASGDGRGNVRPSLRGRNDGSRIIRTVCLAHAPLQTELHQIGVERRNGGMERAS